MAGATRQLCEYAAALRFETLPGDVVGQAKSCVTDTVAAMLYGRGLPWSRLIVDHAGTTARSGRSTLFGAPASRVDAAAAAFGNGALAHAFEMDCLTYPSAGTHPGANLVPPGIAVAQETGASGTELIAALVAGCEVANRIGRACDPLRTAFHAPGILGPPGGAVVAGHLMKLDARRMENALGIAASFGSGIMAFSATRDGGMVKKLHLARAAEGGVTAARLAARGVTGPSGVLEAPGGTLDAFGERPDPAELMRDLGSRYETLTISLKRFAAHITAHTPIQALLDLRLDDGFAGADIAAMEVTGSARMVKRHGNPEPGDLMAAQYSVPFCLALAAFRDPCDPASFAENAVDDPLIRALCRRVKLAEGPVPPDQPLLVRLTVTLRDGRVLERAVGSYPGTPLEPPGTEARRQHFIACAGPASGMNTLFERLDALEEKPDLDFLANVPEIPPIAPRDGG